jgi:hypothetical protein
MVPLPEAAGPSTAMMIEVTSHNLPRIRDGSGAGRKTKSRISLAEENLLLTSAS